MYPNNAYELYQAERTRTRAEVLAADTLRGRWAADSRRGRSGLARKGQAPARKGRAPARKGRGRGIMVIIAGRKARTA